MHCVNFAGIHGSKTTGAYSICLSDGYEDDQDDGEVLYVALSLIIVRITKTIAPVCIRVRGERKIPST